MMLADRLRDALGRAPDAAPILLSGDDYQMAGDPTPAAVLVTIVDRPQPSVLLIRRPDTMRRHPGQVAFPGGRVDPTDIDEIDAALREAEEEIALPRALVEIVGIGDRYRTGSGFIITPVIGVIPPDLPLVPEPAEVAEIFEAPLDFLLEPANHIEQTVEWQGRDRHFFEIQWGRQRIWGATAAMIVNLGRRLAYQA